MVVIFLHVVLASTAWSYYVLGKRIGKSDFGPPQLPARGPRACRRRRNSRITIPGEHDNRITIPAQHLPRARKRYVASAP